MLKSMGLFINLVIINSSILLLSCHQNHSIRDDIYNSDSAKTIENVPFVKQKNQFCGPAAMASIMTFFGQEISQEEIANDVYTPKLKGALISDMENFAKEMGYDAKTINGDTSVLFSHIDQGIPTIVLVDRGKLFVSIPHYYVVYGYDKSKSTFIIHTGFESSREIKISQLEDEWTKMNRLMLIVKK